MIERVRRKEIMMVLVTRRSFNLVLLVVLLAVRAQAESTVATVRGLVTDEKGTPLEGVTVQVSGMEKFRDGAWHREIRLGRMPSYTTDKEGRFVLPFYEADIRYDLWFDKYGFAPTFLFGISAESQELKVLMSRGTLLSGTITRLVNGRQEPVVGTMMELRLLPAEDLWYQRRTTTDNNGRYMFRVSPLPREKKWQLVLVGEVVKLDVRQDEPVPVVDFEVKVTAKKRPGQPRHQSDL
jgi:hypothetical protein